ncbi:MAG: T9SS type A sorting domain-containing protein, partial [Bacteroidota bacterium]
FGREASGAWPLRQRLTPDDIDRAELPSSRQIEFGTSVALEDGTAVVGAPEDVVDGAFDAGSVYVYEETDGTWAQTGKLRGGGREFTNFGFSTAISDGSAVTGEPRGGDPDTEPGVAYVHEIEAPPPPTLSLFVQESIGVSDAPEAQAALQLLVQESIGVTDDPRLIAALALLVQESIGVSDAPTSALADGSAASGASPVRVDSALVQFVGPVGLGITFDGVTVPGGVSVFFEALAPEAPAGIPSGATLAPYRWSLTATGGLAFDSARVAFDADALPRLEITDGDAVTVYRREASGAGTFEAVRTTFEDGVIVGSGVEGFSEFAIAGTGFTVGTDDETGPLVFGLSVPAPNPANSQTRVVLSLPEPGPVQVDVLDLRGRRVATLVQGDLPAGQTALQIRTDALAAGSYIVVLRSGDQMALSRLTVVR